MIFCVQDPNADSISYLRGKKALVSSHLLDGDEEWLPFFLPNQLEKHISVKREFAQVYKIIAKAYLVCIQSFLILLNAFYLECWRKCKDVFLPNVILSFFYLIFENIFHIDCCILNI